MPTIKRIVEFFFGPFEKLNVTIPKTKEKNLRIIAIVETDNGPRMIYQFKLED